MIDFALIGVADDRHHLFVHPVERRRAGVHVVGFSEPDASARSDFALLHPIPAFDDHRELLATARPSMVAITSPISDTPGMIIDALAAGVDVIIAPPVTTSTTDVSTLLDAVADSGRRLAVVHTWRNHPAARLARELIDQSRLGRVEGILLDAAESVSDEDLAAATREVLDLYRWFTGVTAGSVTAPPPAPPAEGEEGQLIMTVRGSGPDGDAACEVVRHRGPAETPLLVQVIGDSGAVAWEVGSGRFRSMIGEKVSPVIAAGLPGDPAQWVLTDLVRRPRPTTAAEELWTTRLTLLAGESVQSDGAPSDWQL